MYQDLFDRAVRHYRAVCKKHGTEPTPVSQGRSHIVRARTSEVFLRGLDGEELIRVYMEPEPGGAVWSAE